MFKKIVSWRKSVFTKDNVKRFVHEMELSVVATASTTVNGFVNDPANQVCTKAVPSIIIHDVVTPICRTWKTNGARLYACLF